MQAPSVYTIHSSLPFQRELVHVLLNNYKNQLDDAIILLPSRRACRNLQATFLELTHGKPMILPQISPLGDIDDNDLALMQISGGASEILDIPPAIHPVQREMLLSKTIQKLHHGSLSIEQALDLANALGQFLDQIIIDQLSFDKLEKIVPVKFAEHWQITLDFLKILSEYWPQILHESGVIDMAERRNRLLKTQSDIWEKQRPQNLIIAAGSTGSVPASAALMKTIANLPNGKVIIPGLDHDMDEENWNNIGFSHHQYPLKRLLNRLDIERKNVRIWNASSTAFTERETLWREAFLPQKNGKSVQPAQLKKQIYEQALNGLKLYACENIAEEAMSIAITIRQQLESPSNNILFVTPNRYLASKVALLCKRWGLKIDDSAGLALSQTSPAIFMMTLCDLIKNDITPATLLAFLKHHAFQITGNVDDTYDHKNTLNRKLDLALRGVPRGSGWSAIEEKIKVYPDSNELLTYIENIQSTISSLSTLEKSVHPFKKYVHAHIQAIQNCVEQNFWDNEYTRQIISLLSSLLTYYGDEELDFDGYSSLLGYYLKNTALRSYFGQHPRIRILGQLEARLCDADLIILGGLNEGNWPRENEHDSFLSRPMRSDFGLTPLDVQTGLSAHDFVQLASKKNIILTRSNNDDSGPATPSRWWKKLENILHAAGIDLETIKDRQITSYAGMIDKPDDITPAQRSAPQPPVNLRPKRLSVTQIEKWSKNPYSIFAQYILNLKPLDDIEKEIDAAENGTILHRIFEIYIEKYPNHIPENSLDKCMEILASIDLPNKKDTTENPFWMQKIKNQITAFIDNEKQWRHIYKARTLGKEAKGVLSIAKHQFQLSGIADRIDMINDGEIAIIDYKSGGQFSVKKLEQGEYPQLPLLAMMSEEGCFNKIAANTPAYLGYWVFPATQDSIKQTALNNEKHDIRTLIDSTQSHLDDLLNLFSKNGAKYYATPHNAYALRYNDYSDLERQKEWADASDQEAV